MVLVITVNTVNYIVHYCSSHLNTGIKRLSKFLHGHFDMFKISRVLQKMCITILVTTFTKTLESIMGRASGDCWKNSHNFEACIKKLTSKPAKVGIRIEKIFTNFFLKKCKEISVLKSGNTTGKTKHFCHSFGVELHVCKHLMKTSGYKFWNYI